MLVLVTFDLVHWTRYVRQALRCKRDSKRQWPLALHRKRSIHSVCYYVHGKDVRGYERVTVNAGIQDNC